MTIKTSELLAFLDLDGAEREAYARGWAAGLLAAAHCVESKKSGSTVDLVVQAFADEIRALIPEN